MFDLPPLLDILVRGIVLTAAVVLWILAVVRIVGLRSFSKMTAFDFVATIATGSLLAAAATASRWEPFAQTMVALAALFAVQVVLAKLRRTSKRVRDLLGNDPVLLMRDGQFVDGALAATRVSRDDVMEKLRVANVHRLADVRAVVLETTGDISIIHGEEPDPELLQGIEGAQPRRD